MTGDSKAILPPRARALLAPLGLFLLAVAVGLLPARQVFDGGTVYFSEGDNYVHLRKILLQVASFPRFVTFDRFEGFPKGTGAIWPPVLDWLLSALSLLVGLGRPATRQVEILAAVVPPILGGLTAVALWRFARRVVGERAALLAAAILPFLPAFAVVTVVGRPDNEMTEPLMTLLMLLAYLTLQERGAEPGRGAYKAAARCGLAMLGALLLWRGAPPLLALILAAALADVVVDVFEGRAPLRHRPAAAAFLLPALLLTPLCAVNVWGNTATLSFNIVSWFHVILFAGCAASLLAWGSLGGLWLRRGWPRALFLPGAILGASAAALLALAAVAPLRRVAVDALAVVGMGAGDPWLRSISQYQPFLSAGRGASPVELYGWTFWAMPLAWALLAWRPSARGDSGTRPRVFFLVTSALLLAMLLLRSRFEHVYAIFVAVGAGFLVTEAQRLLRGAATPRTRFAAPLAAAAAALLAVALLYPLAIFAYRFPTYHTGPSTKGDFQEAMAWLRQHTPQAAPPYDPAAVPAYAVMAPWYYAGWIEYRGERPVVATMYGSETFGLGVSAAYFLSEGDAEADRILDRTGARYVVCTPIRDALASFAQIAGKPAGDYVRLARRAGREPALQPGPRYYRLLTVRLQLFDGMDAGGEGTGSGGAERYRLVYESAGGTALPGMPEVKRLKIFEHLPGARLSVSARPGERVEARAQVLTNRGRVFDFVRTAVADGAGRATLVLPYAAPVAPGAVGLAGPYQIEVGGRRLTYLPAEADIVGGGTAEVPTR